MPLSHRELAGMTCLRELSGLLKISPWARRYYRGTDGHWCAHGAWPPVPGTSRKPRSRNHCEPAPGEQSLRDTSGRLGRWWRAANWAKTWAGEDWPPLPVPCGLAMLASHQASTHPWVTPWVPTVGTVASQGSLCHSHPLAPVPCRQIITISWPG